MRRHALDVMDSLGESLTPACILALVSTQQFDPQRPYSSDTLFTVWKGFPLVFCARTLKSCWFIQKLHRRAGQQSLLFHGAHNKKKKHPEFKNIPPLCCQSSYSSFSPPKKPEYHRKPSNQQHLSVVFRVLQSEFH